VSVTGRTRCRIHGVVDDRVEGLGVVGPLDSDGDLGIVPLEFGEDLRKDVEAGSLVCAHDNLAARDALGLSDRRADRFSGLDGFVGVFQKQLPGSCERYFPPERSSSLAPTSSSRARIWEETAGWVRKRFSAAREKRAQSRHFHEGF